MSQIKVILNMANSLLSPNSPASGPKLGFQTLFSPITEAGIRTQLHWETSTVSIIFSKSSDLTLAVFVILGKH